MATLIEIEPPSAVRAGENRAVSHWNELDRLAALAGYGILDTGREAGFDDIAGMAAAIFDAPIAAVNFIAADCQWFKAEVGLGIETLPLEVSICRHTILEQDIVVVPDLRLDPRFASNPLVDVADGLRFYAGAPLKTPDGLPLGTVCILDRQSRPRGVTEGQRRGLAMLARQTMALLESRRRDRRTLKIEQVATEQAALLELIAAGTPLEACLASLTEAVCRLIDDARAAVMLPDANSPTFGSLVSTNMPAVFGEAIRGAAICELAIGSCGQAVHRGEVVTSPDVSTDLRWSPEWRALCMSHGIYAVHSEPAIDGHGKTIASLALYFSKPRQLGNWERRVVTSAARIAAFAVERHSAATARQKREEQYQLLQEVGSRFIAENDTDAIYVHLVDTAKTLMDADCATIQMLDGSGSHLMLLGHRGLHPDTAAAWGTITSASGTSCGASLVHGKRAMLPDLEELLWTDEKLGDLEAARLSGIRASLSTPLRSRSGQQVGMISTHWHRPHHPDPEALQSLDLLARQAADVLERASAHATLAASAEQLRAVIEAAPLGMSFADASGRIIGGNAQAERVLGHPILPLQSIDEYRESIAHHADGRRVEPHEYPLARALAGEAGLPQLEALYRRGDGSDAWVRFVAATQHDTNGRIAGAVVASLDIDAERRAQSALHELNDNLSRRVAEAVREREAALAQVHEMQKLETIGQLTGGVAHDFNNLLTPIVSGLELLGRRLEGDERAQRLISGGLQSAERARTLIQRLLAFARRQHLEPRPVDVASLIDGMRDLMERSLGPQIRVVIKCAELLPPAQVDPNQFELALLNLAVNARDAMSGNGVLTIAATAVQAPSGRALPAGSYVHLAIGDTGTGMDAQTLKRAVEPFFTTKGLGRGTGLGLSSVHGLAAQSGGAFELVSTPGAGTTAHLWLPLATEALAEPALALRLNDGMRDGGGLTILLVDDEELVRAGTAEMLKDQGYLVVQASSGHEALQLIRNGKVPDALVTDFAMPGMTGAELAREVLKLCPALPMLMITGYAELTEEQAGGLIRLSKPFRLADLSNALAGVIHAEDSVSLSVQHAPLVR